jgi:hypothetical protein
LKKNISSQLCIYLIGPAVFWKCRKFRIFAKNLSRLANIHISDERYSFLYSLRAWRAIFRGNAAPVFVQKEEKALAKYTPKRIRTVFEQHRGDDLDFCQFFRFSMQTNPAHPYPQGVPVILPFTAIQSDNLPSTPPP